MVSSKVSSVKLILKKAITNHRYHFETDVKKVTML